MLAIIYARVSTEDQAKHGYSLESQLDACRQRASSLGADVIEFVDEGISGSILERPGLSAAREMVRRREVQYFICLDPDRLARNLTHQLIVTEEIERARVRLEFVNFEWKATAEGRLFYSLRGAIAEYEKEKIKERTIRGRLQKAKQGGLTHNPRLYGYFYDKETDKLSPNPVEAAIVQKMYQWCAEGHGANHITNLLNDMGIPTSRGKQWRRVTVLRILRNPTYRGEMILHRWNSEGIIYNEFREEKTRRSIRPEVEWIRISVPGIVDDSLWSKVQNQLAHARRLYSGHSEEEYLLSGLLRCGVCGSSIHGSHIHRKSGKITRYYCCDRRSMRIPGSCILGYLRAEKLEKGIWEQVTTWVEDPRLLVKELQSEEPVDNLKAELKQIQFLLTEAMKERARLLDLAQKGLLPFAEAESRLKEVKSRMDKLSAQQDTLKRTLEKNSAPKVIDIKKMLGTFEGKLESLPYSERKRLIRAFIEQIIVMPDDRITIQPRNPKA